MVSIRKALLLWIVNIWFVTHVYLRYVFELTFFKTLSPHHNTSEANPLSDAIRNRRQPPTKIFLLWLHIPKTGTSFANTLLRWGCPNPEIPTFVVPEKERPQNLQLPFNASISWDWLSLKPSGRTWLRQNCRNRLALSHGHSNTIRHPAYAFNMHRAMKLSEANFTVALFRLPRQRTYSNYLHLTYRYDETRLQNRTRISLIEFAKKPQYISQQTKLLLGRHYRYRGDVSVDDADRAANLVVNVLLFVGLTEEFHLSVRLFHTLFGGAPHPSQFENVRPSINRNSCSSNKRSFFRYEEDKFGGWRDAADEIVYFAAFYRFWRDICRMRAEIEKDGLGIVFSPLCYVPAYMEGTNQQSFQAMTI